MEVPLSVEETNPVTLSYCPSVVPVTVTSKVQEPPAASVPPLSEMVSLAGEVLFVTVSVPPHCVAVELTTSSPRGNVSVKATPVNARFPAALLFRVNRNVEVALF